MKCLVKLSFTLILLLPACHFVPAQSKKNAVTVKAHAKIAEKGFGNPQSITDVKDVLGK